LVDVDGFFTIARLLEELGGVVFDTRESERERKLICFCDGFYQFSGELGRLKECDRDMRETEVKLNESGAMLRCVVVFRRSSSFWWARLS